jgi:cardiolipin synthase
LNLGHLPNAISLLRMVLVWPTLWALLDDRYGLALILFAVSGASDGLDGYLAKRYGWTTRLGAILDPLADKTLLVGTYVTLAWLGAIPVWLTAVVVARDVVIVTGAVGYHLVVGRFDLAPSWLSKLNTLGQLVLVIAVMAHHGLFPLPEALVDLLVYGVLVTTVLSGADYVFTWGRRAWLAGRRGGTA